MSMKIYGTWMEKFPRERELYNTREELQKAAEKENIHINWDKWDELVKDYREHENV